MTRQQVVDAVKDAVRATGVQAFEWLATGLTPQQMPAVVIRDTEDELTNELYHTHHRLTIEAVCLVSSGSSTLSDCRRLMATMAKAIGSSVTGCRLEASTMNVEHDETVIAAGTLTFSVPYDTGINEV